jgi:hypothetical protein
MDVRQCPLASGGNTVRISLRKAVKKSYVAFELIFSACISPWLISPTSHSGHATMDGWP